MSKKRPKSEGPVTDAEREEGLRCFCGAMRLMELDSQEKPNHCEVIKTSSDF